MPPLDKCWQHTLTLVVAFPGIAALFERIRKATRYTETPCIVLLFSLRSAPWLCDNNCTSTPVLFRPRLSEFDRGQS